MAIVIKASLHIRNAYTQTINKLLSKV